MAHIAIDARIINSSTGTYVKRMLHYLQDIDKTNKYTVLVRAKDKDYWRPRNKNFSVMVAEFDNYSLAEQIGFKKFLDKLSPDLVHFCMPQQPVFYKGKSVTTFHDLSLLRVYNSDKNWLVYRFKQFVGRFVFRRVAKKSNHIITPSEFTKADLMAFAKIPSEKVTVTYESAENISRKDLVPYKHPFKEFILYVGTQSDYKNIKKLGEAHQILLKNNPDLGLILVGRKNEAVLINEVYFNRKNFKNILFTDFIPDEQRNWLYAKTRAYTFASLTEGFGLPGLEAMSHGAPVVSSNATCSPEIYGEAAHYFDPLDVSDIARAIGEVLADEKLRQELIKKGHAQVKKYSWRRMAEQTHKVYEQVLASS